MYNLLKLNLARNSLRYILQTYKIKELYLPYYLCKAVRLSLKHEDCKPVFYHIDDDFMPMEEFDEHAFILYPNYFGICDNNVRQLAKKYPHLITDNSHAFYNEPSGFACFNSARKFLPVYNGSYLWIKDISLLPEQEENFYCAPQNEEEIIKNETLFDNLGIKLLHPHTAEKIKSFDTKNERKEKFLELNKRFSSINMLNIDENSNSPFCYPCLTNKEKNAAELVKYLTAKGLNIYRYWDKLPKTYNEYRFFARLVPIPLTE